MTERLSMRAIREILRLRWVQGQPHRAVALSTGRSVGAVYETLRRAADAGLDWVRVQGLTDGALDAALYRRPAVAGARGARPQPDCVYLHTERRKPGVTLELLHLEYLERHPDGYRYTQFCDIYRHWLRRRRLTMRQVHRGGEKSFVDYAGKRPSLTDPATGERIAVELFVMVLGACATECNCRSTRVDRVDILAGSALISRGIAASSGERGGILHASFGWRRRATGQ